MHSLYVNVAFGNFILHQNNFILASIVITTINNKPYATSPTCKFPESKGPTQLNNTVISSIQ
jgi:hypothetical protein